MTIGGYSCMLICSFLFHIIIRSEVWSCWSEYVSSLKEAAVYYVQVLSVLLSIRARSTSTPVCITNQVDSSKPSFKFLCGCFYEFISAAWGSGRLCVKLLRKRQNKADWLYFDDLEVVEPVRWFSSGSWAGFFSPDLSTLLWCMCVCVQVMITLLPLLHPTLRCFFHTHLILFF